MLNCQAGTPPVIDDGVPCTDDSCDEVNDVVVNTPNDGNCDDSVVCTTDSCDPGDANAGADGCLLVSTCDDMIACTIDSCDPSNPNADANTGCVFVADDSNCASDGNVCTYNKCVVCPTNGNGCTSGCNNDPNIYGDVDHNSVVNIFDLFCVLDGFSGIFTECTFADVDIEPCTGNAKINIFDLFAVLDAFSAIDPCCGGGGGRASAH